ncbi:hypothetical protein QL285_055808 [Trifolium repens]|nr:hypothetical protein QL285_055808 [Trifolium repens]
MLLPHLLYHLNSQVAQSSNNPPTVAPQYLNPAAQPFLPLTAQTQVAQSSNILPTVAPQNTNPAATYQTQVGNVRQLGLPYLPQNHQGRDYTIKSGHAFSAEYQKLAQQQYSMCINCRGQPQHFKFLANLVQPEDLCARCLVAIGHWSKDLYDENLELVDKNNSFGNLKINYKKVP